MWLLALVVILCLIGLTIYMGELMSKSPIILHEDGDEDLDDLINRHEVQ